MENSLLSIERIMQICILYFIIHFEAGSVDTISYSDAANLDYAFNSTMFQSAEAATSRNFTDSSFVNQEIGLSILPSTSENATNNSNLEVNGSLQHHWTFYIEVSKIGLWPIFAGNIKKN